jgi:hypothetical protein
MSANAPVRSTAPDAETDTITIAVPSDLARAYYAAPEDRRRAWELVLRLRLRAMIDPPKRTLEQIMEDMGREAAANGLTEEELNDILREWDEERKAARKPPPGSAP